MRHSNEDSITGDVYPQAGIISGHQRLINKSRKSFPEIDDVIRFELDKKANLTRTLSCNLEQFSGWLMDKEIASIFNQFSCIDLNSYESKVKIKTNEVDYLWMHLMPTVKGKSILEYISFKQSEFQKCDFYGEPISSVVANSIDEADKMHKSLLEDDEKLRFEKIILKKESPELDFFAVLKYNYYFFVSDRLKSKLEELDNLGVEFVKVKNVYKES